MNPFYQELCPICVATLIVTPEVSSYAGNCTLYDCPESHHYTFSKNADTDQPILARIRIPLFHLLYTHDETIVYLLDPPPSTSYRYSYSIPGHFPLNWDNLHLSAQRLKNLIVFS